MKKFMISGFMDEVGAAQLTIEAEDKESAVRKAEEDYGFDEIVNISEEE